jgi:hypothetical protein
MNEDNEVVQAVEDATGQPQENERVKYLEGGIGPNVRVAIAPNGYIWFSIGVDLISTQGYCDTQVARAIAEMFINAADERDRLELEIQAQALLAKASNVIDLNKFRDETFAQEVSREHDQAVEDAVVAEQRGYN